MDGAHTITSNSIPPKSNGSKITVVNGRNHVWTLGISSSGIRGLYIMVKRLRITNIDSQSVSPPCTTRNPIRSQERYLCALEPLDVCYKPDAWMSDSQREKKKEYFVKGWGTVRLLRRLSVQSWADRLDLRVMIRVHSSRRESKMQSGISITRMFHRS